VAGDVITLAGVVTVMLLLDWRLALVTFAAVPPLLAVALFFRPRARAAYREVRNRIARLNGFLQESLLGMPVIQLFGREPAERAEFAQLNERHRQALFRRMRYDAVLYAVVELIGSVAIAALLWWAGGGILQGTVTFGVLVAFMEYTHRFFLPIRDLSAKYTVMQSAMVASERIFGLLDTPPERVVPDPADPTRRSGPVASPGAPGAPGADLLALELRDVWFAYQADDGGGGPPAGGAPGGDPWVFRGLSLRIPRGQRVAVVGPTGAGKTTLARLLTRTYEPQRGAVLVEGRDVRDWDLHALRRHVGLVLQDVVVFSGTIEENLALGSGATRQAVEEAARRAHVDAFVRGLPGGYGEELRERGANLSHGQRQLLSVARALVYNPPVLVLDEATSSVDPETERLLQDAIDQLLEGRTSIVIAHRFSTIQRVDRVLVLQHGRVVEDGSPAELLAQGGLYAALWELQQGRPAPAPR
jgi:ATP-binding cassette subfamily B protein